MKFKICDEVMQVGRELKKVREEEKKFPTVSPSEQQDQPNSLKHLTRLLDQLIEENIPQGSRQFFKSDETRIEEQQTAHSYFTFTLL